MLDSGADSLCRITRARSRWQRTIGVEASLKSGQCFANHPDACAWVPWRGAVPLRDTSSAILSECQESAQTLIPFELLMLKLKHTRCTRTFCGGDGQVRLDVSMVSVGWSLSVECISRASSCGVAEDSQLHTCGHRRRLLTDAVLLLPRLHNLSTRRCHTTRCGTCIAAHTAIECPGTDNSRVCRSQANVAMDATETVGRRRNC